jgi:polysaccharide pyruvyl transferase WcaK-like protein
MADLGLAEYCLDIHSFDAEVLKKTFIRMVSERESIKARMAEKSALFKEALTGQFDRLFISDANEMGLSDLELSRSGYKICTGKRFGTQSG